MEHLTKTIMELIRSEMAYWRVPGMALTIVREGMDPITCGFGWRDSGKALKVDQKTQFGIASCAKAMTAALIGILCGKGLLDLDIPVRRYAPELLMMDREASEQMTLRDMLCHRTGLPPHDALWPGAGTRAELAKRIRFLTPNEPFRGKAQYSNLMYAMAGYVAECAAGGSWETLMKEYLFRPLGMRRTRCKTEELKRDENHAEPYQIKEGSFVQLPIWNVDLAGPAASVYSTAEDMAAWLAFQIRGGKTVDGTELMPSEFFGQMHHSWSSGLDNSGLGEQCFPCSGYGFGWCVGNYRGRELRL